MSQPLHLASLPLGTRVQDPFVILAIDERSSQAGPFTVLTLGNSAGSLASAPFWIADQPRIAGLRRGDVVQVIGEIAAYHDRRQLHVSSIRVLPKDALDWHDLVPTVGNRGPFWQTLDRWREQITRPRLRASVDALFEDPLFRERFGECPGALVGPHAARGGLLKHTTEVAAIARAVARVSTAETDLVTAGALLHDIGKLDAYEWSGPFRLSRRGELTELVVLGALALEQRLGANPPPCTETERQVLRQFISAAGRADSRPEAPVSLEAEIVRLADRASMTTAEIGEVVSQDRGVVSELRVSRPVPALDGRRVSTVKCDWGATPE